MVTTRSSTGWRSTSRVGWPNSGSSSRKRTPRWERLISPGRGWGAPPARAGPGGGGGGGPGGGAARGGGVAAGGGDLEGALDVLLAAHLGEVGALEEGGRLAQGRAGALVGGGGLGARP